MTPFLGSGPRNPNIGQTTRFSSSPRISGSMRVATTTSTSDGIQTRTIHFGNPDSQNGPPDAHVADLAGIFGNILSGMHGTTMVVNGPGGAPMDGYRPPGHPLGMLAAMLSPANARAGDAVFSQEALDRVIDNLMQQHNASSAPGPASETAISALPKIKIAKEHLDSNGKAECSICMDTLSIGDEVTELPCKHWFHGECVAAWLREHDTCPQCRRGITPQDGDANTPRATGEAPRFWQPQEDDFAAIRRSRRGSRADSADGAFQGFRRRVSSSAPNSPTAAGPSRSPRSHESSRGLGGIANWMGRRFSGGGSSGSGSGRSRH